MLYLVEQSEAQPGFEGSIRSPVDAARISQQLIQLGIKRLYIAPQRAALETVQGFLRCAETAERGIQIVVDYNLGSPSARARPLWYYGEFGIMRTHQLQGHAPPRRAAPGTDAHAIHLWQWWSYVSRDIMDNPVPSVAVPAPINYHPSEFRNRGEMTENRPTVLTTGRGGPGTVGATSLTPALTASFRSDQR